MSKPIYEEILSLDTATLKMLLSDKTTKQNIIWATDNHPGHNKTDEITVSAVITEGAIRSRASKAQEEQLLRQREKAEVFTPSWICNKMNNHCDTEWFGRENVFNTEDEHGWTDSTGKIAFPEGKTWQDYVESKRIEITCGEAPYIVSRYDTTTGEDIPVGHRIGILDRKLRVVGENTEKEEDWLKWTIRAFQSVYGFEFQGDNLLIARINLVMTFIEYYRERWGKDPDTAMIRKIANIVCWNFWQMDGLTDTIPFGEPENKEGEQTSFFDMILPAEEKEEKTPICRIYDWKANRSILFTDVKRS